MHDTLISRDSKGKIRQVNISYELNNGIYIIKRSSGLYKGRFIEHPNIVVEKGKAKRTLLEQVTLVYNSNIKDYLDKGYKNIKDFGYNDIKDFNPENILPKTNTDTKGVGKPMLCKVFDKTNPKLLNTSWLGSYKLDGVRAWIYNDNGVLKTSSRGGQDYNIPATYILQDPYIQQLFKDNPNLILDGEIYRHGWHLSKISGLCRLINLTEEHKELKFYCYDIVNESMIFKDRLDCLNKIKESCPINSKLVIINHSPVTGLSQIMALHDKAVSEGYEGLVVRNPNQTYKCGARDNRMCKIKIFQDSEYQIVGLSEGLRDEDLCFVLKTPEGYEFKAKPIGTREDKQWYRDHVDELIGQLGVVKYFGMTNTEHPVPNLPVFKCVRLQKDI